MSLVPADTTTSVTLGEHGVSDDADQLPSGRHGCKKPVETSLYVEVRLDPVIVQYAAYRLENAQCGQH